MHSFSRVRGFTLVELMVAVSIILVMLSILTASYLEARQNSRDRQRVSDIAQIQFVMEAYREVKGYYPKLNAAQEQRGYIGYWGGAFKEFWDVLISDPRQKGGHESEYMYRIVPKLECDNGTFYAVLAIKMENAKNSNGAEVCPGNADVENAYIVIISGPLSSGGPTFENVVDDDDWWNDEENQPWYEDGGDDGGSCTSGCWR